MQQSWDILHCILTLSTVNIWETWWIVLQNVIQRKNTYDLANPEKLLNASHNILRHNFKLKDHSLCSKSCKSSVLLVVNMLAMPMCMHHSKAGISGFKLLNLYNDSAITLLIEVLGFSLLLLDKLACSHAIIYLYVLVTYFSFSRP